MVSRLCIAMVGLSLVLPAPAIAGSIRETPVVKAVQQATPAVVAIDVAVTQQSPFPFFQASQGQSQGSGVIIRDDGIVLTNAHVVQGATEISAVAADGQRWQADLLAMEPQLDLAVLRLRGAKGVQAIEMADSEALMLGETTIAIGNPLGLGLTVSTGVLGSVSRQVEIQPGVFQSYLQTDAAINPGNSGGALVDLEGRLIGINTAIRRDAQGIGFAIPVNRARKVAEDLLLYGSVRAPWLGCDVEDIHPRRLAGTPLAEGALLVERVHAESPCAKAGLKPGDLVFRLDAHQTRTRADLNAFLADKTPGAKLTVSTVRGDQVVERTLVSAALPSDAGSTALAVLGVTLQPVQGGVLVSEMRADGAWARARLKPGDAIVAVDGVRVRTEKELLEQLAKAKARHRPDALFTVSRGRASGHVQVEI